MKYRKLKGGLFATVILGGLIVLAATSWKQIIVGIFVGTLGLLALVLSGIIVSILGNRVKGERWDKD